jgi:glycine cleavage system regulatory protein
MERGINNALGKLIANRGKKKRASRASYNGEFADVVLIESPVEGAAGLENILPKGLTDQGDCRGLQSNKMGT